IRVGWKAVEVVHTRRKAVDNAGIGRGGGRHVEGWVYRQSRILEDVSGNPELLSVVVQAIAAAHHKLVIKSPGTPGNTDLGSEVVLLRIPRIVPPHDQTGQEVRASA